MQSNLYTFDVDDAIKSVPVVNAQTSKMEAKCYCLFSHCTYFKSDGMFLVKLVYVLSSPNFVKRQRDILRLLLMSDSTSHHKQLK